MLTLFCYLGEGSVATLGKLMSMQHQRRKGFNGLGQRLLQPFAVLNLFARDVNLA